MPTIPPEPPALRFTGARVLDEDGLVSRDLSVAGGRIVPGGGRAVDASGYMLLPGIVDLHGDGFERHVAPRRGAQGDPETGLAATEAELAANGITTAVLAQFLSWEGGMRGPDFAEAMARAVAAYRGLVDLRLQLRLEVSLAEEFPRALRLIDETGIGYLVLNDHLNHAALAEGRRPPRLVGQALKSGRSPEAHEALLHRLHKGMPDALAALAALVPEFRARGVRLGSHDDRTPEDRARNRALGADIAEFPETLAAAQAAKAAGEAVIMGAPNVVRGGSHDGKVAAADLIAEGLVDALVSDYHYPAPHRAALALWRGGMDLSRAWGLVSAGPAAVMGWSDRGRIAEGLRADLVLVDAAMGRIDGTLCAGQIAHLRGPLAARLLAGAA
jgi:alpha-D-ribose 1-methylphosphonate 5-triphosphate diphosphatase